MQETRQDLFETNTTETLGVRARYVLQHNAISRSAHSFSAAAKKLTAMAMALLNRIYPAFRRRSPSRNSAKPWDTPKAGNLSPCSRRW
ncbi:MAG: hypothetical protein LBK73_16025 [Treponema sp.]|jgi:hypothetical protein|nr:hypothetical protein [Treponema sp.]